MLGLGLGRVRNVVMIVVPCDELAIPLANRAKDALAFLPNFSFSEESASAGIRTGTVQD